MGIAYVRGVYERNMSPASEVSSGYPRIYQVKRRIRINALLFLAVAPTVAAIISGKQHQADLLGPAILFIVGMLLAASVFRARITLSDSAIESRSLFGRKRLGRDQILGKREYIGWGPYGGVRTITIAPKEASLPAVKFDRNYAFDDFFFDWLKQLPDLSSPQK